MTPVAFFLMSSFIISDLCFNSVLPMTPRDSRSIRIQDLVLNKGRAGPDTERRFHHLTTTAASAELQAINSYDATG